ncbi:hypothetical protein N5D37_11375 [Comamonas aquatica]|uniref:hypothetical protein n=1 Tax=Comamonas aquatica TaxID=225991 RepID=UPI002446EC36|nr:hypothetical protein [Comamonas aquatica]MDH1766250.1 hypothetical protein [Comamonas aquatica]
MPHQIGFVEAGGGKLAHQKMLEVVATFAAANGWTVLRFDDTQAQHELLLKAPGLSGTEEIFVGMRTYENVSADYYNLTAAGFTGYVPSNAFAVQPGAMLSGVPAHNQRIDYWLTLNGQRLVLAMKVGTPVYESMYLGKALPYARPDQYPYPMVVGGMLVGEPATRFSDTAHSMPYKGGRNNLRLRFNDGNWLAPTVHPWSGAQLAGATSQIRDTNGYYPLLPCMLISGANLMGELDGVFQISGFNNVVENTLSIGGEDYVVIQDVGRNGFNDYYAMRLDA